MATDIQNSKKKASGKLNNLQKTREAVESISAREKLTQLQGQLDNVTDSNSNSLNYMLDLFQQVKGPEGVVYLRKRLIETALRIGNRTKEIFFEELIQFLNCNIDFVIPSANTTDDNDVIVEDGNAIRFKVKSVDPFSLLKEDPSSDIGKALYEKELPQLAQIPYSFNRELYDIINNPLVQYDYFGASGQRLFTIEFDNQESFVIRPVGVDNTFNDNTITSGNDRKLNDFLRDYYDSIELFELQNFMTYLIDALTGVITIQKKSPEEEQEIKTKFGKFIQKILDFCGDDGDGSDGSPIGTSGISHIGEDTVNTIDDDFFEFDNFELRDINEEIGLRIQGLIRFVTCDDIEGSVNQTEFNNDLNNVIDQQSGDSANELFDNILNNISFNGDENNRFSFPQFDVEFSLDAIKEIPRVLLNTLLTPKVLMGVVISIKATSDYTSEDIKEILNELFRIIKRTVSQIKEELLTIIWEEVKKEILILIARLASENANQQNNKLVNVLNSLIETLLILSEEADNLTDCRSVLDTVLKYLNLPPLPPANIPKNLLQAAKQRSGFSNVRAFQNVLENLDRAGVNTDDLADGSPNPNVLLAYSIIEGMERERSENGKVEIVTEPLNIQGPFGNTVSDSGSGVGIVI